MLYLKVFSCSLLYYKSYIDTASYIVSHDQEQRSRITSPTEQMVNVIDTAPGSGVSILFSA